jgi:hypothetical protein
MRYAKKKEYDLTFGSDGFFNLGKFLLECGCVELGGVGGLPDLLGWYSEIDKMRSKYAASPERARVQIGRLTFGRHGQQEEDCFDEGIHGGNA